MPRYLILFVIGIFLLPACNLPVPQLVTHTIPPSSTSGELPATPVTEASATLESMPTEIPTATRSVERPAETPVPTDNVEATEIPLPTEVEQPPVQPYLLNFTLQEGSPVHTENYAVPSKGCNFTGVGGQVFGKDGAPLVNIVVQITGMLGDERVDAVDLTGSTPGFGPGGYFLPLADQGVDSQGKLQIQLFNLNAIAVSPPLSFDTFADCNENLVVINFVTIPGIVYLPYLPNQ